MILDSSIKIANFPSGSLFIAASTAYARIWFLLLLRFVVSALLTGDMCCNGRPSVDDNKSQNPALLDQRDVRLVAP